MQLLVTGATGKVGQAFIARFLADPKWASASVVALCHNRTLPETARLKVVRGSIADPDVVKALVGGHQRSALDELTERERAVLSLLAEGCSNRAIAKKLYLSTRAVERHVQSIFEKLRLPDTEDDNRRVLAVLALLGQ